MKKRLLALGLTIALALTLSAPVMATDARTSVENVKAEMAALKAEVAALQADLTHVTGFLEQSNGQFVVRNDIPSIEVIFNPIKYYLISQLREGSTLMGYMYDDWHVINGTTTLPGGTIAYIADPAPERYYEAKREYFAKKAELEQLEVQAGREGEVAENAAKGLDTIFYEDGSKYVGQTKNGEPEGAGALYPQDAEKFYDYSGMFKNGVRHGFGNAYPYGGSLSALCYYENGKLVSDVDSKRMYSAWSKEDVKNTIKMQIGNPYTLIYGQWKFHEEGNYYAAPAIKDGHTLIPIRSFVEGAGGNVAWDAPTSTATITLNDTSVSFVLGDKIARVNGENKEMEVAAQVINGKTMIPLRFACESVGITDIIWTQADESITIKYPKNWWERPNECTDNGNGTYTFRDHFSFADYTYPAEWGMPILFGREDKGEANFQWALQDQAVVISIKRAMLSDNFIEPTEELIRQFWNSTVSMRGDRCIIQEVQGKSYEYYVQDDDGVGQSVAVIDSAGQVIVARIAVDLTRVKDEQAIARYVDQMHAVMKSVEFVAAAG